MKKQTIIKEILKKHQEKTETWALTQLERIEANIDFDIETLSLASLNDLLGGTFDVEVCLDGLTILAIDKLIKAGEITEQDVIDFYGNLQWRDEP